MIESFIEKREELIHLEKEKTELIKKTCPVSFWYTMKKVILYFIGFSLLSYVFFYGTASFLADQQNTLREVALKTVPKINYTDYSTAKELFNKNLFDNGFSEIANVPKKIYVDNIGLSSFESIFDQLKTTKVWTNNQIMIFSIGFILIFSPYLLSIKKLFNSINIHREYSKKYETDMYFDGFIIQALLALIFVGIFVIKVVNDFVDYLNTRLLFSNDIVEFLEFNLFVIAISSTILFLLKMFGFMHVGKIKSNILIDKEIKLSIDKIKNRSKELSEIKRTIFDSPEELKRSNEYLKIHGKNQELIDSLFEDFKYKKAQEEKVRRSYDKNNKILKKYCSESELIGIRND